MDLLSVLRDRSTVGVTRCQGGVGETEVTRVPVQIPDGYPGKKIPKSSGLAPEVLQ